MLEYVMLFFGASFVFSIVSAITENRPPRDTFREAMKSFLGTTSLMVAIAVVTYFLSR